MGAITLTATGTAQTITGNFRWVLVAADTVITSMTGNVLGVSNANPNVSLAGITLPAGFGFGGIITSITITSGTILAYSL